MSDPGAADEEPAPRLGEILALVVVLAATVAALALALRHPLWEYFQPGPGLFPALAAGLSALCATAALGTALLARRRGIVAPAPATEHRRLVVYLVVVLAWPATFASLGFAVSSLAALVLLLRLGEGLRWPIALGIAALTVALGWLLFERLLGVPLPHGLLPG